MKPFLFTEHSKLSDLLSENHKLVLMIPRFGIEFGFGEKRLKKSAKSIIYPHLFLFWYVMYIPMMIFCPIKRLYWLPICIL